MTKTSWTDGEKELIKLKAGAHSRVETTAWSFFLLTIPASLYAAVLQSIVRPVTIIVLFLQFCIFSILLIAAWRIAKHHEKAARSEIMKLDAFLEKPTISDDRNI